MFNVPKLPPLVIMLALLTGCARESFDAPRPCEAITLPVYGRDVQARVAGEMDAAPGDAAWPDFVRDYGVMRAAVRVCKGAK